MPPYATVTSQVLDYEAQQRSLDSDNSNRNDTGGKFAGKIPATCYTTTNKMNSFKQLELVVQSSRGRPVTVYPNKWTLWAILQNPQAIASPEFEDRRP
jgi:hypothetical protein